MLGNGSVRVYELLQHASTLFGLIVIVAAYAKWLKGVKASAVTSGLSRDRWRYALLYALAAASAILATLVTYEMSRSGKVNGAVAVVRFVICATTIFAVALCSTSLMLSRRGRES